MIRPEEWEQLRPVFEAEGGRMPEHAYAAVAFDEQGLAGFWTLQPMFHAGPLWIRPDQRGTGLWGKLHGVLDGIFSRVKGSGYYSFSGEPKVETIFRKLGYNELPYKLWKREF